MPDPAAAATAAEGKDVGAYAAILANTPPDTRNASKPWLLAPIDLQAVKAAGVTFAISMLERVIEERARGNPAAAVEVRNFVQDMIGDDLSKLVPGSPEAQALKDKLIEKGWWSQYLEVGIGPDAEIFTKSQIMAAVGHAVDAGINPVSQWNNRSRKWSSSLHQQVSSSAPRWAMMSICAMWRAAQPCCSARRKTTMPLVPLDLSSGCLTPASTSITCARWSWR
jgi:hypothetical protein